MGKKLKADEVRKAVQGSDDSGAVPMADLISEMGLEQEFEAGKSLTFNLWKPEVGNARAFEFLGMEERTGEIEGKETTFHIFYARDIKTNEEFSFIGGGLFSYIVQEKGVKEGTFLIARYNGMVELENNQRAKQWEIKILNRKAGKK